MSRRTLALSVAAISVALAGAPAFAQTPSPAFQRAILDGLSPEARADMWTEIARMAEDGMTVLLTTHYLEEADQLADHLVIVDRGKQVAEGTPDQLKSGLRGDAVVVELASEADLTRAVKAVASQ